ncbi:hypothetical protein [Larsenimonas suaedae]|uniref:Uncharacterized protein n=1 Tax=Larsenimonas suaedae TaxID=1851019 RepID=A0ABU1GVN0_9GAMM|nr:hypothetical protein [Larsenimonas suaedae]MCM2970902.1 hypothetical protein [Larsenimonas suaedae]MDR5895611.1 hypothetical protein [Larsenimonas suaedae]
MGAIMQRQPAKVIDLSEMRERYKAQHHIVRLAPELDGLQMVYQVASDPDAAYAMPILGWAMKSNGDVVGVVPWLDSLVDCETIDDPEHGVFLGYRDPETDDVFDVAPSHKQMELEHSAAYFDYEPTNEKTLLQSLPDTQGTHALCVDESDGPWQLKQVYGWQLYNDGSIEALLVDDEAVQHTPILMGDDCLYPGKSRHEMIYFFQRTIANRIKEQDPDTMNALAIMVHTGT